MYERFLVYIWKLTRAALVITVGNAHLRPSPGVGYGNIKIKTGL